jgi:hypothetical protein
MISHQITVFNEPTPKVYTPPTVYQSGTKPDLFVGQLTYDAWLKQCGFAVGDFVTLVPASTHMSHMAAVHRITRIEPDFQKLTWSSHGKEWKPFHLVGCNLYDKPSVAPWARWDSISGYRHLTQHEQNALIAPVYAKLQDYCTKHG